MGKVNKADAGMRIKRIKIERIRITGKKEEFQKGIDYAFDNGYRVTHSGHKRLSATRRDPQKIVIWAEKEIEE